MQLSLSVGCDLSRFSQTLFLRKPDKKNDKYCGQDILNLGTQHTTIFAMQLHLPISQGIRISCPILTISLPWGIEPLMHLSSKFDHTDEFSRFVVGARSSPEDLGKLLEYCRNYLLKIANQEVDSSLRVKASASDLVQETFLKAAREFDNFRGNTEAELLAWLRQILKHNLQNLSRSFGETVKREVAREIRFQLGIREEYLVSNDPSPSSQVERNDRAQILAVALSRLPEDYQRVIRLRHQEQMSFAEIGENLGRSADAARKLWGRAIEYLQRELFRDE